MIAQEKEKRIHKMTEKSDDFIKRLFPHNLIRLGAIILCFGIAMGFGGNKLFGYLVDSSTNLDFQKINAKLEAVDTRIDVDEKVIAEDNAQIRELVTLNGKIDVITQKVLDIKETVDKLQQANIYNNYQHTNPSWSKDHVHDPSQPW